MSDQNSPTGARSDETRGMQALVHVGPNLVPGGFDSLAESLVSILAAGYEYHVDQATLHAAIKAFNEATRVTDVRLSDMTINGSGDTWELTADDVEDIEP